MNVDILGWVSGFFAIGFGISQIWHVFKTKHTEGLSILLWQLYFGVQTGWTIHAYNINNTPMFWMSMGCGLVGLSVLVYYYLFQTKPYKNIFVVFGPGIIFGLIFSAVAKYLSAEIIGLIFIIPAGIGQISQLLKINYNLDIRGVSVTMLLLYVINQAVNLAWGILINESVLKITAISSITILTISIITYYYKIRKQLLKIK